MDLSKSAGGGFDEVVERRHTGSMKWRERSDAGMLPMWVADMDFRSPPAVLEALQDQIDHGVLGYAEAAGDTVQAVQEWLDRRYGWSIDSHWIVWLPGLVPGLHAACRAASEPGEAVATFTPIYPPFLAAPGAQGRERVSASMVVRNGRWEFDLAALEAAASPSTRMLLLSHPQNPTGRALTRSELESVAELAARRDWTVCSDEVHCDLLLDDRPHLPFAMLGREWLHRTITLMSPAKTFNIAGLNCGFAVIPDAGLRRRFLDRSRGLLPSPNLFSYVATRAAFTRGEPWRQELLSYLRANRDLLAGAIRQTPPLSMTGVEATYLAWIDARGLGVEDPAAHFEQAGLWLSDGRMFGMPGFVRLNFGCPRVLLEEGIRRLRSAVSRRVIGQPWLAD